ncbi:MAG: hypothetical protein P8I38_09610 [Arenicella sp.]|jgi:hypothetical protein|nr:hypothetical protein [Arenicella sp.]
MSTIQLETDYLIIGCGAVGMAFADVLLSESDANILIVDNHHKPGGHWNDAYPFVTLHQPSAFYGVGSAELSSGRKDEVGLNKGLMELATGGEVMSYFNQVMQHRFLPSGRVQYFPMCQYAGDGKFSAMLSGQEYQVSVNKKIVDGTHFKTSVPATHTRSYSNDPSIDVIPLNELPQLKEPRNEYVVVGGGKTGIDAVLWMLENQIPADRIKWIMPRDGWLMNRENAQPAREFFMSTMGAQALQAEAIGQADSMDDLFDRLEDAGCLLRIYPDTRPKMYHGATVSQDEITELRKVTNVVRLGRVKHINPTSIELEQGSVDAKADALYIDCSARAVPVQDIKPVFDGKLITVQTVRTIQPVFSASFIAHVEANYDDQDKKNDLCTVVPLPNDDVDWLLSNAGQMQNQFKWSQEAGLREWLISNRLDGFTGLTIPDESTTEEEMAVLGRLRAAVPAAAENMPKLMREVMTRKAVQ